MSCLYSPGIALVAACSPATSPLDGLFYLISIFGGIMLTSSTYNYYLLAGDWYRI